MQLNCARILEACLEGRVYKLEYSSIVASYITAPISEASKHTSVHYRLGFAAKQMTSPVSAAERELY